MNAQPQIDPKRLETLGPAERILNALTSFTDHMVHNRPGVIVPDARTNIGVRWEPVTWVEEGDPKVKVVYKLAKVGKKTTKTRVGILGDDKKIREGGKIVGEYRRPGLFPEVATWMYRQVADVYKMDNEFAAKWASWAFPRDHRDLKVVLAAFMLVQSRSGEPVIEDGKVSFHDDDFRAVGEAMCLLRDTKGGKTDLNPKLLLRVGDVLNLEGVAAINRELGFGKSAREPARGRYYKAVEKWLRNREANPKMLEGLVKAGFRSTVMDLAKRVGFKPETPKFFEVLRWKQAQAKDGRRTLAIGVAVKVAETWEGLSERDICERIVKDKPGYKRIVGLLPSNPGMTRAIMASAIEAGCLSDADLIILTPTLEDLGLLNVQAVRVRWSAACDKADNQRAANIATRVKKAETVKVLEDAADKATARALEEVTKNLRVYVCVDKSGSMEQSLSAAKGYLTKFLGGFPLDRTHVSVFNTMGTQVTLKAATAAAVEQAFKGHAAGGGTDYASGVQALVGNRPKEDEDTLFIFVGDEGDYTGRLGPAIRASGLNPVAFGLLKVPGENGRVVQDAAQQLGIPCFMIEEALFNDPYTISRTLRHLIASTPVGTRATTFNPAPRKTLVQEILETPILAKPAWAA